MSLQEELLAGGKAVEPLLSEMEMYRARAQESFAYVFSSDHTTLARMTERPDPELSRADLGGVDAMKAGVPASAADVVQPPARYKLSVPASTVDGHGGREDNGGHEHGSEREPVSRSKSCVLQ